MEERSPFGGSVINQVPGTRGMEEAGYIHQHIQVHMGVGEVYAIRIGGWNDPHEREKHTVKIGAVRGHRRDPRDGGVDNGRYLGVVWLAGETLKFPKRLGGSNICADRTITLTALIQAARSAEVMLLHSFLTLGDSQAASAEMRNREDSSTMRRISRKAIPGPGARRRDSGDWEPTLGASSFYGVRVRSCIKIYLATMHCRSSYTRQGEQFVGRS